MAMAIQPADETNQINTPSKGYVVVVGASNVDICAKSNKSLVKEDSNIGKIEISPGGVGRNIAENLALLGVDTRLITALGDDDNQQVIQKNAQKSGIKVLGFVFEGSRTGVYSCIMDSNGKLALAVNDMTVTETLSIAELETLLSCLQNAYLVVCDANLSPQVLEYLTKVCPRLAVDSVSTLKTPRISKIIDKFSLIKMNFAEAKTLANTTSDNPEEVMESLNKKGVKNGIITLGSEGALCFYHDGKEEISNRIRPKNTKIVNTNGCGDAFFAGFIYGMVKGYNNHSCMEFGQALADFNALSADSVNRDPKIVRV